MSDTPPGSAAPAAPVAGGDKSAGFVAARRALREELLKLVLMGAAGATLGWMLGHTLLGFSLVAVLCLAIYLRQLAILRQWMAAPKHVELPEPGGIWGEVFEMLLELQRRNRKRKKKLAAILGEFQASTAALPDGAVVLGERGEIVWFNKASQALLGLRMGQDQGIRIGNLIRHPDFAEYLAEGQYSGTVQVPSPVNRNVSLALQIIPYGNNQRLLIVHDVSELRRLEIARRDFLANASHELRTPLTVLRGYLDMIEPDSRGPGPLAPWRMPITEMRAQATRMESLIRDMLKLAKLESEVETKQDVLEVPLILQRVIDDAIALSKGSHRFETEIDAELFLYGRETEVQSVFTNLVSNAVRYSPEAELIRVRWYGDEEGAHFLVQDFGIGVTEDDLPRLSERFYRVDVGRSRESGGTGLGLSIVKHALERHEGRLEIESRIGEGSRFFCHFPVHRVHRAEEPPEKSALAG